MMLLQFFMNPTPPNKNEQEQDTDSGIGTRTELLLKFYIVSDCRCLSVSSSAMIRLF